MRFFNSILFSLLFLFNLKAGKNSTQLERFFEKSTFFNIENGLVLKKISQKLKSNKNLDVNDRELEISIIEDILLDAKSNDFEFSKKIIKLQTEFSRNDPYLFNVLKYHLARNLENISPYTANRINNQVLNFAKKNNHNNMSISCLELKGSLLYRQKKFNAAAKTYLDLIKRLSRPTLYKSSFYNNASLCFLNLGRLNKAYFYNEKALSILNKSPFERNIKYFKALLFANKGEIVFQLGKYEKAKIYLKKYYEFILDHPENDEHASKKLWFLYQTYIKEHKNSEGSKIISYLEKTFKSKSDIQKRMLAGVYLINIYSIEKNATQLIRVTKFYNELRSKSEMQLQEKMSFVNDEILNFSLNNFAKKENLKMEIKTKKNYMLIVLIMFCFLIVLIVIYNRYKFNLKQLEINKLIYEKTEQNLLIRENQINQLQLNIELKNSMNKIFVDNIKSLRKNKNASTEMVLKELQMQLSNLIQIDKKNFDINESADSEKKHFFEVLKTQHPELTKMELELCGYLRLDLSSKELASLMNNTDGTIRVYKTKLKEKLGIPREGTIEGYLKEVMEKKPITKDKGSNNIPLSV